MIVSGTRIVELALAREGVEEVPKGSNRGPFVEQCQHATWLSGTEWPWCAAFVCEIAREASVPLVHNSAGAHDLFNRYQKAGCAVTLADARPGDVIDFNIGSGHTGILVSKNQGTITTIDGNWGDKVTKHESAVGLIRGIWRIPGVSEVKPPPPKRLPPFTVVTSASGHRKIVFRTKKRRRLLKWLGWGSLAHRYPNGITITRGKAR